MESVKALSMFLSFTFENKLLLPKMKSNLEVKKTIFINQENAALHDKNYQAS